MSGLLPTDAGVFPHAQGHLRERRSGLDQAILIYCTRGAGWCELGGHRHVVRPGELLAVPPEMPHVYGADERRPWSIHWVHVKGSFVRAFLDELEVTTDRPVASIGEDPQLLALFEDVLESVEHGHSTVQLLYASQAAAHLIAAMIRAHRRRRHDPPTSHLKIAQTVSYMHQHLSQPLQLSALAAVANLSRSQFAALFKQQTGCSPMDYFTRLRMHRACRLLDTTDLSVKAVAAAIGYEDPLYFSRAFRGLHEKSPTDYRQSRKG